MSEQKEQVKTAATPAKPKGKKKERNLDAEIKELFNAFDEDNSNSISLGELRKAMNFMGLSPTRKEVKAAMDNLDKNGNGKIELKEFKKFIKVEMEKNPGSMDTEASIRSAFKVFDRDGNGYIDGKELKYAMKRLGESMNDAEIAEMLHEADVDGDGRINYEEFVKIWSETL
ncbi:calmodulin-A-like isoform X2 [Mizuhopecten yessoensis]|uniref:calmodulin-A-like isoform X2 n=1 Tax=Mizuhopecten yessoensis TaxID=6573 RepID=UPI000B45A435|nr:calmodulin-A-like isoform X2 [Mizuhopecten yessoensis]